MMTQKQHEEFRFFLGVLVVGFKEYDVDLFGTTLPDDAEDDRPDRGFTMFFGEHEITSISISDNDVAYEAYGERWEKHDGCKWKLWEKPPEPAYILPTDLKMIWKEPTTTVDEKTGIHTMTTPFNIVM